jgi:thioesterase domain-containing protein
VRSNHQRAIAAVWANNDRIADSYRPKPYPGRITQFVPFRNYTHLRKADVGWEGIARDGVDVQSLPVYPAGLLMEPYVRYLADEISKRIERKQEPNES